MIPKPLALGASETGKGYDGFRADACDAVHARREVIIKGVLARREPRPGFEPGAGIRSIWRPPYQCEAKISSVRSYSYR
jgi:hypothetical protein